MPPCTETMEPLKFARICMFNKPPIYYHQVNGISEFWPEEIQCATVSLQKLFGTFQLGKV